MARSSNKSWPTILSGVGLFLLFAAPVSWAGGELAHREAAPRGVASCEGLPRGGRGECPWHDDCCAITTLEESLTSSPWRHSHEGAILARPSSHQPRPGHSKAAAPRDVLPSETALDRCVRMARLTL